MKKLYDPKEISIDGIRFISLRRYEESGKVWHLFAPNVKQTRRLKSLTQNSKAHLLNRNFTGNHTVTAEVIAVWLTPEGINPERKNHEDILREVWEFPYRFIVQILGDLQEAGEATQKK